MMKKLAAILTALLVLAGCAVPAAGGYQRISMAQAAEQMEQEQDYILLDVRTAEEFAEGHIPGAVNVPNESITEAPEALPEKEQRIYVYCRSGNRSRQASDKLVALG